MTDLGLDYAFPPRPDLAVAWAAGYRFVSRYLSWLPSSKCIDAAELADLRAHGFQVALNWEFDAQDALGGASAGHTHGAEAVRQAQSLGYPAGCTVYFSADFDETPAQAPTVDAYMRAAASHVHGAGYRMGAYGGYWTVKRLLDAASIDDGWQTFAWSGGLWDPRVAMRQIHNGVNVGGADCDIDERVGVTYLMGQIQATTQGDDMPHFLNNRAGADQWMANGDFTEVWGFSDEALWRKVLTAAGQSTTIPVDAADVAAGVYGQYMGVYTVPRVAPTPPAPVIDMAAVEAAAEAGAKAAIEGATIHAAG